MRTQNSNACSYNLYPLGLTPHTTTGGTPASSVTRIFTTQPQFKIPVLLTICLMPRFYAVFADTLL